jgi:hypothetical protein
MIKGRHLEQAAGGRGQGAGLDYEGRYPFDASVGCRSNSAMVAIKHRSPLGVERLQTASARPSYREDQCLHSIWKASPLSLTPGSGVDQDDTTTPTDFVCSRRTFFVAIRAHPLFGKNKVVKVNIDFMRLSNALYSST